MPKGNRTAIHIHLLLINAKLPNDLHTLGSESLINLEQAYILQRDACPFKSFRNRLNGSNPHNLWFNSA
ncbi:hypothetical protein D3C72_2110230 [compost metagenome]